MKKVEIDFTIEAKEDLHIGSGVDSIGLYDDGVVKDDDGFPTIKSETLKGMIKQSLREVKAFYNSIGEKSINRELLFTKIFDSFIDRVSLDLKIYKVESNLENPYIIHTFTKIDDDKRKAEEGSLRSLEFVSKGYKFGVILSYVFNDKDLDKDSNAEAIFKFLEEGVLNLKWLGGSRRRGFGEVHCEIKKSHIKEFIIDKSLKDNTSNLEVAFVLELEDDVTIGGGSISGNHIETLDYIPGSTILGALRSKYYMLNHRDSIFDDNSMIATFFYPIDDRIFEKINENTTSLPDIIPVPASLRKKKEKDDFGRDENKTVPYWILSPLKKDDKKMLKFIASQDTLKPKDDKKPESNIDKNCNNSSPNQADESSDKSIKGGYIYLNESSNLEMVKVSKTTILRNRIDPKNQSCSNFDSNSEGELFSQEQISKETKFVGSILFKSVENANKFYNFIKQFNNSELPIHIGRGGKIAKIKKLFFVKNREPINIKEVFTLTFVTDAIFFDENLKHYPVLDADILAKELNEFEHKDIFNKDDFEFKNSLSSSSIYQSISGTSGLKRFSESVLKKGSCYLIELKKDIDETKLESLKRILSKAQREGFGYRTEEGFGQFRVNHPIHDFKIDKSDDKDKTKPKEFFIKGKSVKRDNVSKNRDNVSKNNEKFEKIDVKVKDHNKKGLTPSIISHLYGKLEANVSDIDIKEFFEHNKTREALGEKYKALEEIYNDLKDDKEVLKLVLLKLRKNKGEK
ncbi:hypothetical protein JXR93_09565 [bacterium]|nr:hypothetical protein [bacterium]